MYDPKTRISMLFMDFGLKYKIIIQKNEDIEVLKKKLTEKEKEILDHKHKIKEKDVKMKRFSSISVKIDFVPEECSSSRNPSFHLDEHHIKSFPKKPYADKIHHEKPQAAHTRKVSSEPITILK
ncbi:unnamed protein product [Lactuca saligna]|uniref:Uncharacterized protein n=1 Tax=Lactuca saligna TaxID=75948 RepID=A0AA35YD87_LACSI|nr:unnamed protein product [Lactuca saligna]